MTKIHANTTDSVPFYLRNAHDLKSQLYVDEPLSANYITDDLKLTHSEFRPSSVGVFGRVADVLLGERSNGVLEKEEMLTLGTCMLGLGKVSSRDGVPVLEAPSDGSSFILTTMSKRQLVKSMRNTANVFRAFSIIFGLAGGVYLVYKLYQFIKRTVESDRNWRMFERVRAALRERRRRNNGDGDSNHNRAARNEGDAVLNPVVGQGEGHDDFIEGNECVVCAHNQRNVVLLDCGHVYLCVDCAEMLPEPRRCPVCRDDIRRVVPLYHA